MKKILVCGCTGFMGYNISYYFRHDYEVVGVAHTKANCPDNIKLLSCDLTTQKGVDHVMSYGPYDVIIQAAATTSGSKDITTKPYIHVTDNAVMNSLLLRAAYEHSVPQFIFLSCGVMYQPGDTPRKETDYDESDKIVPAYFGVGWTKVYIEKMCEFYSRLGRTKHMVIRHSNTFGPQDKYDYEHSHVFGATVRKVMDAEYGDTITVWGNGTDTARDLIYVDDVVHFIDLAINLQHKPYDLVNVSYGKAITVKEMVESIIVQSGKDLKITYDTSKPAIPTILALDNNKALVDYGWKPLHTFSQGIFKTMKWYGSEFKG